MPFFWFGYRSLVCLRKEPSDIRTRAKLVERVPGHLLAAMRNVYPDIPTTLIISRGEVANSAGYYTIQSS